MTGYCFFRGGAAEGIRWLQSAPEQTLAPATDLAVAETGLAALSATRGRTDLTFRLVRSALSRAGADPRQVVRLLASAEWNDWAWGDTAMDFVTGEVRRLAEDASDPVIDMWAELCRPKPHWPPTIQRRSPHERKS